MIAFLAVIGLLTRPLSSVMHEHDGGSDPHQHVTLLGCVGHPHAHPHPHGGGASTDEPATEHRASDENGRPEDGDRHSHVQDAWAAAVRRTIVGDDGGARAMELMDLALRRAASEFQQPCHEAMRGSLCPGEGRDRPQPRTGRTIDRLIQGIGLLI